MQTLTETDTLEELLADLERCCEGGEHSEGLRGHAPDAPASVRCTCPCGWWVDFCAPRVTWARLYERGWRCRGCKQARYLSEWDFQNLPER